MNQLSSQIELLPASNFSFLYVAAGAAVRVRQQHTGCGNVRAGTCAWKCARTHRVRHFCAGARLDV